MTPLDREPLRAAVRADPGAAHERGLARPTPARGRRGMLEERPASTSGTLGLVRTLQTSLSTPRTAQIRALRPGLGTWLLLGHIDKFRADWAEPSPPPAHWFLFQLIPLLLSSGDTGSILELAQAPAPLPTFQG